MEQILNICQKSYKGRTYPDVLNFNQLGLEQHGIKIIPYVTEKQERKSFDEALFRKWLNDLEEKGTCITLWKGKYRVTVCQKDYQNMTVVGALFIPNDSILHLFGGRRIDRTNKLKAKDMLTRILTVNSIKEPSLLMLINNVNWNVEIVDYLGRQVFKSTSRLTENKASELLKFELNKIQYKWERLSNAKN